MGHEGHEDPRFRLPRAAQIPLPPRREGEGESEEQDLLRRLGGFGLSPVSSVEPSPEPSATSVARPNAKPQVVSRPGRFKYWLLAGLAILAIAVPIGVYTLVPGVKDGKFAQPSRSPATGPTDRLVAVPAEPTSATPPPTATRGDEIHPSPASSSDQSAQLQLALRAVPSPDISAPTAAASSVGTATSPASHDVGNASSIVTAAVAPPLAQTNSPDSAIRG